VKKLIYLALLALFLLTGCAATGAKENAPAPAPDKAAAAEQKSDKKAGTKKDGAKEAESVAQTKGTHKLGGLSPEDAFKYMKETKDLVIVQVNTAQWKIDPGFDGALWIPHDEMEKRYNEIPAGRPVILHCGAGVVSVPAYETLLKKRPDIPELSYIAGSPHGIMKEYNAWVRSQKK